MMNVITMASRSLLSLAGTALLLISPMSVLADGGDLRSAVQNPISSLISLPFKFTFDFGAQDGEGTMEKHLSLPLVKPIHFPLLGFM